MDEKDFEVLCDLAKTCNISRTSQRLFTTQSAITKRLQKMEEDLQLQLFVRSKKGLQPTPALESILPEVRAAMEAVARVKDYAASCNGEISGTLRMGVSVNYARYRLPEVLADFMSCYPKVDIHIKANRSTNVYRDLMNGETSFAIVRGEYAWRGGNMTLSEDQHCLVMNRAHDRSSLNELTFIARESDAGYMAELAAWMNEQGLRPSRLELIINDVETILTLVNQGVGWSVLPGICLGRFQGNVEPIRFRDGRFFSRRTHILYRADYYALPQVQAFIEVAGRHERD